MAGLWRAALRGIWASWTALIGAALATTSGGILLLVWVAELFGADFGPYHAIFSYGLLPVLLLIGLLLLPVGLWRARQAELRGEGELRVGGRRLVLDLDSPLHRRALLFFLVMSGVNLLLLGVATYNGYGYLESTPFCGTVCHTVMEPQYATYQRSPHAAVPCVACHVGSGATSVAEAKLSGLRQVWGVVTGTHSRPVPAPVESLRPAGEICGACHPAERFYGERVRAYEIAPREGNLQDPVVTVLRMHTGGRNPRTGKLEGNHWHASPETRIEFRAADPRRRHIPEVRRIAADGQTTTWVRSDLPPVPEGTPWRVMDCTDCHNRVGHELLPLSAALDRAFIGGLVDPTLPGLRELAQELLQQEYATRDEARTAIREGVFSHYRTEQPTLAATRWEAIAQAATGLYSQVYAPNVFPEMKVGWRTYPSQSGHLGDWGCYRCHDDQHKTSEGKALSQDCDLCHSTLAAEERRSELASEIKDVLGI